MELTLFSPQFKGCIVLCLLRENVLTYEDLKDKRIVMISDEAHRINAWTRGKLTKLGRGQEILGTNGNNSFSDKPK